MVAACSTSNKRWHPAADCLFPSQHRQAIVQPSRVRCQAVGFLLTTNQWVTVGLALTLPVFLPRKGQAQRHRSKVQVKSEVFTLGADTEETGAHQSPHGLKRRKPAFCPTKNRSSTGELLITRSVSFIFCTHANPQCKVRSSSCSLYLSEK